MRYAPLIAVVVLVGVPIVCSAKAARVEARSQARAVPTNAFVDRDCGDFLSQAEAQKFFIDAGGPKRDPHGLDRDKDGIACEDLIQIK